MKNEKHDNKVERGFIGFSNRINTAEKRISNLKISHYELCKLKHTHKKVVVIKTVSKSCRIISNSLAYIFGRRREKNQAAKIFEKIIGKVNNSHQATDPNSSKAPNRINVLNRLPKSMHIIFKMLKVNYKKKMLKAATEGESILHTEEQRQELHKTFS